MLLTKPSINMCSTEIFVIPSVISCTYRIVNKMSLNIKV